MRRKTLLLAAMTLLMVGLVAESQAQSDRWPRKLGRGVQNVLLGWMEIPKSMIQINKRYGDAAGATWGFFRGIERFYIREKTGLKEIVTFRSATGHVIEPEFYFMPEQENRWRVREDANRYFK